MLLSLASLSGWCQLAPIFCQKTRTQKSVAELNKNSEFLTFSWIISIKIPCWGLDHFLSRKTAIPSIELQVEQRRSISSWISYSIPTQNANTLEWPPGKVLICIKMWWDMTKHTNLLLHFWYRRIPNGFDQRLVDLTRNVLQFGSLLTGICIDWNYFQVVHNHEPLLNLKSKQQPEPSHQQLQSNRRRPCPVIFKAFNTSRRLE